MNTMLGAFMKRWRYSFLSLFLPYNLAFATPQVTDGDIIFQTSKSSQSLAVQSATRSRYSHMGIVFLKNSKPFVLEAISTVKFTPLDVWIARGVDKHFVVKRLQAGLKQSDISELKKASLAFEGRPYDLTFEWSDDRIYCSELVWKLYKRALGIEVGEVARLKDFDLSAAEVKKKLRERFGNNVPLQEVVISPDAIYNSKLLDEIARG